MFRGDFMNRRGFTLVELLATLIIIGVVVSVTIVSVNYNYKTSRDRTEDVFVKTIENAIKIYIESDVLKFGSSDYNHLCSFTKTIGTETQTSELYVVNKNLTFNNVINSTYKPILKSELVNPANKGKSNYECNSTGTLKIYRDSEYVYYYKISKASFNCLNKTGNISNLPSGLPSSCN